jgi:peptidoglycan hydrolase CwlO-like protein
MKSDQLQTSLNANISGLQGQVNILNSTANYLKTEVDNLTLTLNQTSSSFQGQIDSLGNTITGLQAQINSLNSTLQTSTSNTQKQYNSLNSQLNTISKIMYLLAAMTAVLIVTAVYIAVRKPKQKRL